MGESITRRMRPFLGTFVEVAVQTPATDAASAIRSAFESIEFVHNSLSFHDSHSELSRINSNPGTFVPISRTTAHVLRLALSMMRASGGAFDPTIGGLLQLQGRLPSHDNNVPVPRGTVDDVELKDCAARVKRPIRLTVDGIAKGYAVDLAVRAMKRAGACAGWINAGGDMRAFGNTRVPVHVRKQGDRLEPLGFIENAAIATSQASQSMRFPGHIVDRQGTCPADGVWTVLARHAWRADALTKVAALTHPSHREQVIAKLGGRWIVH